MLKRIFDSCGAALGLVLLSPLLIVAAVFVVVDTRGPIFYRGVRVGKNGKKFRMFKFRTMVVNADTIGGASTPEDDPRITRVGGLLRRYKLDELPQLLNVLKGDMSLVGPRPQVPWAVDLYTEEEKSILALRPGITDYASLRFANEGEILRGSKDPDRDYFEKIHVEKMRLSIEYARGQSFWLDCRVLFYTIIKVLFGVTYTKSYRTDLKQSSGSAATMAIRGQEK